MSTIYKSHGTATSVAGTFTQVVRATHSILMWLYVKSESSDTTFDVKLIDPQMNEIFIREDEVSRLSREIALPSLTNWALKIENASKDEDFTYSLMFKEL